MKIIENLLEFILIFIGLFLIVTGSVTILERDKEQRERIVMLETSLNEQIQEKQVYINILERSSNGN